MTARLVITDGTIEINLLNKKSGYVLNRWRPTVAGYKGRGVYQSSPISDGRRLVARYFENAIETFDLKARGFSQDDLISETQELRRLLEKAADYWVADWQDDPVWIEAQASRETNLRYAIVHQGRIAEDGEMFSQPFLQPSCAAAMDNLTLIVERGHWTANQPGSGDCAEIWASETYNQTDYGVVASEETCDDIVYTVNKQNQANLTHAYWYDATGAGSWSGNLIGMGLPFDLLPDPIQVGDIVYFGIDTTVADAGPFNNLVFDIGTIGAGYAGTWKYQNVALPGGPGWAALTVLDNTAAFFNADVNSVHWKPPDAWEENAVNGVAGWWVMFEVTGVPGGLTTPEQQTRDIYTTTWPVVDLESDIVAGDIPALSRVIVRNQSDMDLGVNPPELYANRIVMGLRSVSRGADFNAYLNAADEQYPAGVTFLTYSPGGSTTTIEEAPRAPAGKYTQVLNAPASWELYMQWPILSTHSYQYFGKFKVFARGWQINGATGDILIRLRIGMGTTGGVWEISDAKPFLTTTDFEVLDLGNIILPTSSMLSTSDRMSLNIRLQAYGNAATDFFIYDLILVPVDEWAGDFVETSKSAGVAVGSRGDAGHYLDVDSITFPKEMIKSLVRDSGAQVRGAYQPIVASKAILQANAAQRLWFFAIEQTAAADLANPAIANTIQVFSNDRYLSARGSR